MNDTLVYIGLMAAWFGLGIEYGRQTRPGRHRR